MIHVDALRQMAFGICALCAAGGVLQIFWPENGYKPVINTVLVLYIITSVLQMRPNSSLAASEVFRDILPQNVELTEYQDYADQLAAEASVTALQQMLLESGIQAEVQLVGDICQVNLLEEADAEAAKKILDANAGTMSYEIVTGGDAF